MRVSCQKMPTSKKTIKIIIKIIVALVLVALVLFVSVFLSGINSPKLANKYSEFVFNSSETVERFIERLAYRDDFDKYNVLATIPETENGYVPQGYCYCESQNLYAISYYHDEKPSIIAFIDAKSGLRVKSINLYENEENAFNGHVGGVGNDAQYLYITCDESVARISFDEIMTCEDYDAVVLNEYVLTDVKCSYLNCDGEYLYVGEFYTNDGNYPTDDSHHIMMSPFEISFSRVNVYSLSDIENDFIKTEKNLSLPTYCLAVRERVQGIARGNDGTFYLSISYGRKNYSYLERYENIMLDSPDYVAEINEKEIPVYFLDKDSRTETIKLPPMLEGIDLKDGKMTGIFESGAQKYSDAKFIENSICEF